MSDGRGYLLSSGAGIPCTLLWSEEVFKCRLSQPGDCCVTYRRSVPLDSIVSLSVALAEAPGACACLLGAGVSVDAGVPTGWGIFQDGLHRLYRLEKNTDASPADEQLEHWLHERGYDTLGYSSLLDLIAPDPAIRREMLAGYFSGVEPGPAHEHLADLAVAGVLRVFVTTNFDRLLERALAARGMEPVVVSDDATLVAAPRREHSDVFIVKAHGDYLQETIRNTPSELAVLDPKLTDELRAIADHYGLLVLGWSGSDPALAEIVRGRTSRYGAWWLSRGESPTEPARTLIEAIGARTIVRTGAADFLAELDRRLAVYRTHESGDDPGSVHDQVLGLVKRADEVELDEMLRRERYAFESGVEAIRADYVGSGGNTLKLEEGWARLAAATDRRIASLIPLALYRSELLEREVQSHVAWASSAPPMSGLVVWIQAWHFPFWIIGMTIGGLAIRLERYAAIRPLLSASWADSSGWTYPFVGPVGDLGRVVAANFGPKPPENQTWSFAEWQWFVRDLQSKEWLVARYPEWLRREGEPQRALIEFCVLLNIAAGLRDEHAMTAWWSMDAPVAERYAQRLHRDAATRAQVAEAVGTTLAVFDERAPDIFASTIGMGMFPETRRTAQMLKTGSWG
jgi:hypothetical protein